jgi:hypothetical protein
MRRVARPQIHRCGKIGAALSIAPSEKQELMLVGSVGLPVVEAHDAQFRLPH